MNSQKADNVLNLALDATEAEREKSAELDVGTEGELWEVIIKYSGDLDTVREVADEVTELQNEYAVLKIQKERMEELASLAPVEFIEKPKLLFFELQNAKREACITRVQRAPFFLLGEGVLVGIVDSGIDYTKAEFKNMDGTTRIAFLWDQMGQGTPPEGFHMGAEYSSEDLNRLLKEGNDGIAPGFDVSGHGTAVASIAAGNDGVAPKSMLLGVKMGLAGERGFPRTTELMQAVDYCIRKALQMRMPLALNISFGNTYGSHDGTSLVERYLDDVANIWKSVICVGSGNEGETAGHTAGILKEDEEVEVRFSVQERQQAISIQIWKEYQDLVDISLISPSGRRAGPIQEELGTQRLVFQETEVLLYYGEPSPFSTAQEIYLTFLPTRQYLDSGEWRILLSPRRIVQGNYEMWMPSGVLLNRGTGFLYPVKDTTLTIPSTASRVVTVGAYDAATGAYAGFSGRGFTRQLEVIKPDLAAPGVGIAVPGTGGEVVVSGTSFAVPFVTGSAALLMEWGIIRENDRYLYGEKVKAYLRRGAKKLPGFSEYPNPQVGYGALCLGDSIPG